MTELNQEYYDKQKAELYQAQMAGANAVGYGHSPEPKQPSLRERISNRKHHAIREQVNSDRLQELEYLFDKHPEVARIFELLDMLKLEGII
jgi:hypothetical protein